MGSLYLLHRWEQYILYLQSRLDGKNGAPPDFFSRERQWAARPYATEATVRTDAVKKAPQVLEALPESTRDTSLSLSLTGSDIHLP